MNSLGILLGGGVGALTAQWIVDGVPDQDVMGFAIDRTMPHERTRAFRRDRTVEQLGALFGDVVWPDWHPRTARNVRRSALHDRLAARGAYFGVTSGYEYPEWFADPGVEPHVTHGWHRDESFPSQQREHRAIREAVGMIDMSLMANVIVQGRDAEAVLNRLSDNDVSVPIGRVGELGWELHVPSDLALTVYDALVEAGADLGYRDVGLLAMNSLRLEKTYRDYGLDVDNTDTPIECGLEFCIAWDKPGGFIGLGMVEDEAGIPAEAIAEWNFELEVAGRRVPAVASLRPLYDPDRTRIKG